MPEAPLVTVVVRTRNRAAMLTRCLDSLAAQTCAAPWELLVVDEDSTDTTADVLAACPLPQLRVVTNRPPLGAAGAANCGFAEAQAPWVAIIDDDDLAEPDWVEALVDKIAITDAKAIGCSILLVDTETGKVESQVIGRMPPEMLIHDLIRGVGGVAFSGSCWHRATVLELGGLDTTLEVAEDYHLWLRLLLAGHRYDAIAKPMIHVGLHADNSTHEKLRLREQRMLERVLREILPQVPPQVLSPDIDWPVMDEAHAIDDAWRLIADRLNRRYIKLPEAAAWCEAQRVPLDEPTVSDDAPHVLFTMYGWYDAGGGTQMTRMLAKEFVRRGWKVTVFTAPLEEDPSSPKYTYSEIWDGGVRVCGIFNRAHLFGDWHHPLRELNDPPITTAFRDLLDKDRPDLVHVNSLHNLGAALLDEAFTRGIPTIVTTHDMWSVCIRNYLLQPQSVQCLGPGTDGSACASCNGSRHAAHYARRNDAVREALSTRATRILAPTDTVRDALCANGFAHSQVQTLLQASPAADAIIRRLPERNGSRRVPGQLTIGFIGSDRPLKGLRPLVRACQQVGGIRLRVMGVFDDTARRIFAEEDQCGVVEHVGSFVYSQLPALLEELDCVCAPSQVWETQSLVVQEAFAAGLPVIATRMGGLASTVRDEVDGLLVPAGDVDAIAVAIKRMAHEPGLYERLVAGVERPRGWTGFCDELEGIYQATMAGSPVALEQHAASPTRCVRWIGRQREVNSLSIINQIVTGALEQTPGFCVQREWAEEDVLDPPLPRLADLEVRHAWPPDFTPPRSGRLVLIQPWELGTIPADWIEPMNTIVDAVWVPSQWCADRYVECGVDRARLRVIPNGVDRDLLRPDGPEIPGLPEGRRYLYVGGTIARKGIDVLAAGFIEAFAGCDDAVLIIKENGSKTFYRGQSHNDEILDAIRAAGVRVHLIDDELSAAQMAALYRACDVFVHPYRGEGFAMPVLEAMSVGLPVLVTEGGPTDEFTDADCAWYIPAERVPCIFAKVPMVAEPWWLAPDPDALAILLRDIHALPKAALTARGAHGRARSAAYSWPAICDQYAAAIDELLETPALPETAQPLSALPDNVGKSIVCVPAWHGDDQLGLLLQEWVAHTTPGQATLHLIADPFVDGGPEHWQQHVMALADGLDFEAAGDIQVLQLPHASEHLRSHIGAADGLVSLHAADQGLARWAAAHGVSVATAATLRELL